MIVNRKSVVRYVDDICFNTALAYVDVDDVHLQRLAETVVQKGDLLALAMDASSERVFKLTYNSWLQSYMELYYYVRQK